MPTPGDTPAPGVFGSDRQTTPSIRGRRCPVDRFRRTASPGDDPLRDDARRGKAAAAGAAGPAVPGVDGSDERAARAQAGSARAGGDRSTPTGAEARNGTRAGYGHPDAAGPTAHSSRDPRSRPALVHTRALRGNSSPTSKGFHRLTSAGVGTGPPLPMPGSAARSTSRCCSATFDRARRICALCASVDTPARLLLQ